MNKTSVFVLIFLSLVLSQGTPQYEYGYGAGVYETQMKNHILMASNDIGRNIDIEVKFSKFFDVLPKVAIATSLIDMEQGSPSGYTADVATVNHRGFTIRVTALSQKGINSIAFNWMATSDPQIFVEYVDTKDLHALLSGGHEQIMNIPLISWDHEEKPLAASYLVGAKFGTGNNPSIQQKVTAVFSNSVDITFTSNGNTPILEAYMCLVFTTSESAFNTGELGLRVDNTHEWISRTESKLSNVAVNIDIPSDIAAGNRAIFGGLTGFETSVESRNLRINIQDLKEKGEQLTTSYGTWSNSVLSEIGFNAFVFAKSESVLYGDSCAVVYSESHLQGISTPICKDQALNWAATPIKSFYIPPGGSLTLFNGAEERTFTETHDKFNGLRAFGFVAVSEEEGEFSSGEGFESSDGEGFYEYFDQTEEEWVQYNSEESESFSYYTPEYSYYDYYTDSEEGEQFQAAKMIMQGFDLGEDFEGETESDYVESSEEEWVWVSEEEWEQVSEQSEGESFQSTKMIMQGADFGEDFEGETEFSSEGEWEWVSEEAQNDYVESEGEWEWVSEESEGEVFQATKLVMQGVDFGEDFEGETEYDYVESSEEEWEWVSEESEGFQGSVGSEGSEGEVFQSTSMIMQGADFGEEGVYEYYSYGESLYYDYFSEESVYNAEEEAYDYYQGEESYANYQDQEEFADYDYDYDSDEVEQLDYLQLLAAQSG